MFFLLDLIVTFLSFSCNPNQPSSLRSDISISPILDIRRGCVRIAKDPISKNLYYANVDGSIYEVYNANGSYTSSLVYQASDYGINFVQGMVFHNDALFILGNNRIEDYKYVGKVVKGLRSANGKRIWTTVVTTEAYGLTNTTFDHGYSGITVSPDGRHLYISSGSRTDHGEEQSNHGRSPGLREEPLTSAIFKIPLNSKDLILENNEDSLKTKGYLYADGTRNVFDLAFAPNGHLFGCENGGDRDDPDELNWLREGKHYGFPWIVGGNINPMQFAGYDFKKDKLLNPGFGAVRNGYFYDDPAFPKRPNIEFIPAIRNLGPDADKFRDSISGKIKDASDLGINFRTFTSHRSPLGIVFDQDQVLKKEFRGDGFLLGWTAGSVKDEGMGPFEDAGQDLLHIKLLYDSIADNYNIETRKIVGNFNNPVDCEIDGNIIYVLEHGGYSPKIWKVVMPK